MKKIYFVLLAFSLFSCGQNESQKESRDVQLKVVNADSIYYRNDSINNTIYSASNNFGGALISVDQEGKLFKIGSAHQESGYEMDLKKGISMRYMDAMFNATDRSNDFKMQAIKDYGVLAIPKSWVEDDFPNDQVLSIFTDTSSYFSDYSITCVIVKEKYDPNESLNLLLKKMGETMVSHYKCKNVRFVDRIVGATSLAYGIRYENLEGMSDAEGVLYLFRRGQTLFSMNVPVKQVKNREEFYNLVELIAIQLNNL